jgi:outer membrane cobalamin receptor
MGTDNKFKKAYMELNESKKKDLRENFNKEFEYSNDAFYKKSNSLNFFWNNEKKFIANAMGKTVTELFEL